MKAVIFIILLCLPTLARASNSVGESGKKLEIIDLGRSEIEGKIRRPSILIIESQSETRRALDGMTVREFQKLEEELVAEPKGAAKKSFLRSPDQVQRGVLR